jgi:hypothetical protein
MPSRRAILAASLLLLVGAVVNVGVAWGIAASLDGVLTHTRAVAYTRSVVMINAEFVDTVEVGWPMRALGVTAARPGMQGGSFWIPGEPKTRGPYGAGWLAPDRLRVHGWFGGASGRIPLTPIPAGFTINTFFYTAILALPLSVFPIRGHLRARRGRCPTCGYDLAGLRGVAGNAGNGGAVPCPECGGTP